MHRSARAGAVRAAAVFARRGPGGYFHIHNIAGQFALSETAQAHLAVEKGDKLGTVIVDCAR